MIKKILIRLAAVLLLGAGVVYLIMPPVNVPIQILRGGVQADELVLADRISLPDGFSFTVFATDLPRVRTMLVTEAGDLLATTPRTGEVHLLYRDSSGDGAADDATVILSDLDRPFGLEFLDGWLYVAEPDAIGRIRFDPSARKVSGSYERIVTGIPSEGRHISRTIALGPDGWLYVTVGSSCNVCIEKDPRQAAMLRISPDGKQQEIYATGLRNSVGFDWSPRDGALYAVDNGRDMLGDDFPPEELNRIVRDGFYGWPFINGFGAPDPELGTANDPRIADAIDPVYGLRAHNAPLGMRFLRSGKYPQAYHHDALVALHGSWNRREKTAIKSYGCTGPMTVRSSKVTSWPGFSRTAMSSVGRSISSKARPGKFSSPTTSTAPSTGWSIQTGSLPETLGPTPYRQALKSGSGSQPSGGVAFGGTPR